jgi:hypothetical protein
MKLYWLPAMQVMYKIVLVINVITHNSLVAPLRRALRFHEKNTKINSPKNIIKKKIQFFF